MLVQNSDTPHALFAQRLHSFLMSAGLPTSPKSIRNELLKVNPHLRITQASVSHWLSGRSMPRSHNVKALADWLNVSPSSLVFGDNETSVRVTHVGKSALTLEASRVLEGYMALRPQHRHSVLEVIKALTHLQKADYPSDPSPS